MLVQELLRFTHRGIVELEKVEIERFERSGNVSKASACVVSSKVDDPCTG